MTKLMFLLSKDPALEHAGDIELSRLVMRLAADAFDVSALCLSSETGSVVADVIPNGLPLTRVRKPKLRPLNVLVDSMRSGRSLVHARFDTDDLLACIEQSDADVYAAEHSYMAETFLRSTKFGVKGLVINTINTESQVWKATRGALGRIEAPRLLRDEIRVGRACDAIGTYDAEEAQLYRDNGARYARWMDVTFPPEPKVDVAATPPRLVLLGTRHWPPNQEAFLEALRLWPRIAAGVPDAELCVVGAKKSGAKDPVYPDGVRDLGFVEDLDEFLRTCRASIAPVKTGGGLRAKILNAASRGLPVVATSPAIGSLASLFDLTAHDDDESFVAECRRYLLDRDAAASAGNGLYETSSQHWSDRRPHNAVEELMRAGCRRLSGA